MKALKIPDNTRSVDVQDLNTRLVNACKRGMAQRIGPLVAQGASPQAKTKIGKPLLNWAAELGKLDICIGLLNAGAEIENTECIDYKRMTPLLLASRHDQVETCQALIERGAALHALDGQGQSALYLAALYGHVNIAKVLLDAGANSRFISHAGDTVLHACVRSGSPEVAQMLMLLLDHGADAEAKNQFDFNAEDVGKQYHQHAFLAAMRMYRVRASALEAIGEIGEISAQTQRPAP